MSVLDEVQLHFIDGIDELLNLRSWLGERRPRNSLGIDTETGGFDRKNDALRLVQIGDGRHGWAIPFDDWKGAVKDIVKMWEGEWDLHNSPFDVAFLEREGVMIPRHKIFDTMTAARINEPHHSMALKTQSGRHVDPAAAGLQNELAGTKWTWANVPLDYGPYWTYGALDPVLTWHLRSHHEPIVRSQSPDAYDLEMAVLWVVQNMSEYGAHVDVAYARERLEQFEAYCLSVEEWCMREYGVKPGSNQAVADILVREGFDLVKRTAKGATSLDSEVLESVNHPLAAAVLNRRQAQKMASTYLRHYIDDCDENHLMHPSINTLGARTSRMSMDHPNLQNLPRLGTTRWGDAVRNCINSRYDGGALIMCDFDQIEARLLAHCANDERMIAAFGEGDFFINLARQIFNDPSIQKKDPRRQMTKNATYANLYGAGIRKFSITAGITEDQARDFMARWNALFPGVRAFQNDVTNAAIINRDSTGVPFVNSPFTNRPFVAEAGKEYALVNYVIQGSAAELLKRKLVELDAAGLGEFMVAPVHDEIICDVPRDMFGAVAQTLHEVMNDDKILRVPVSASVSTGYRWGEKVDVDVSSL